MKKQDLIEEIILIADYFDKLGMEKEADVMDRIMTKVAQQMDMPDKSDFERLKSNINSIVRKVLVEEGISNVKNLSPQYIKKLVGSIGVMVRRSNGGLINEMTKLGLPVTQNIERWINDAIQGNISGMSDKETVSMDIPKPQIKSPEENKGMLLDKENWLWVPKNVQGKGLPAPEGVKPFKT